MKKLSNLHSFLIILVLAIFAIILFYYSTKNSHRESVPIELQNLQNLELRMWPEAIMLVKCKADLSNRNAQSYCEKKQKEITDRRNSIDWEDIIWASKEYADSYNCDTLREEEKSKCLDYKVSTSGQF